MRYFTLALIVVTFSWACYKIITPPRDFPSRQAKLWGKDTLQDTVTRNKPPDSPAKPYVAPVLSGPGVYISGYLSADTGGVQAGPVIWKNDTPVAFPQTGYLVYDKNGIHIQDVDSIRRLVPPVQYPSGGSSTLVADNGDIYELIPTIPYAPGVDPRNLDARYTKNGDTIWLTQNQNLTSIGGSTTMITKYGSDIYICGKIWGPGIPSYQAVYWKNGVMHYVPGGFEADFIEVTGDSVIIGGLVATFMQTNTPYNAYWINDEQHILDAKEQYSLVGLAVSGGKVYPLESPSKPSIPLTNGYLPIGIAANGSEVYIIGDDYGSNYVNSGNTHAIYVNGSGKHVLGPGSVNSILIVK